MWSPYRKCPEICEVDCCSLKSCARFASNDFNTEFTKGLSYSLAENVEKKLSFLFVIAQHEQPYDQDAGVTGRLEKTLKKILLYTIMFQMRFILNCF